MGLFRNNSRLKMAPQPGRLYAKALFKVEGCEGKDHAGWYIGKKCAFVYRAKNKTSVPGKSEKSNLRVIWGKVTRTHGNAGSVRAKFSKNLPPTAMGRRVRIMMYPSRI